MESQKTGDSLIGPRFGQRGVAGVDDAIPEEDRLVRKRDAQAYVKPSGIYLIHDPTEGHYGCAAQGGRGAMTFGRETCRGPGVLQRSGI